MSSRSPALTFVAVAAAVLLGLGLVLSLPMLFKVLGSITRLLLSVALFAFTLVGLFSCVLSRKRTNIKILWVIVMILAPFFGPLLWFVWGKSNT